MGNFFRKATAIMLLVALVVTTLPPSSNVSELLTVPTANAAAADCLAGDTENFAVATVNGPLVNFSWDHAGTDDGDCDDINWRIVAVNQSTFAETIIRTYLGGSVGNLSESFNHTLSIPDATYRFRLENPVNGNIMGTTGNYIVNYTCDPEDITSLSVQGQNNNYVNDSYPTATWSWAGSVCDNTQFIAEFYDDDNDHLVARIVTSAGAQTASVEYELDDDDYFVQLRRNSDNQILYAPYSFEIDTFSPDESYGETFDVDEDGYIDGIRVYLDENNLIFSGDWEADFTVAGRVMTNVIEDNDDVVITLEESEDYDTDATPSVTYTNNGNITDQALNSLNGFNLTPNDEARPVLVEYSYKDTNANGAVDSIELVFSEPVEDDSLLFDDEGLTLNVSAGEGSLDFNEDLELIGTNNCQYNNEAARVANSDYLCLSFIEELTENDTDITLNLDDLTESFIEDLVGNTVTNRNGLLFDDGAGPVAYQLETKDTNANGFIDAVKVYFTEEIDDLTLDIADEISLSTETEEEVTWEEFLTELNVEDNSCDGEFNRVENEAYLCIDFTENEYESVSPYFYGDTNLLPTITFTNARLEDLVDNAIPSKSYTNTLDTAAPVVQTAFTHDLGVPAEGGLNYDAVNGKLDAIELRFSEPIDDSTLDLSGVLETTVVDYFIRNDINDFSEFNCSNDQARESDSNYFCVLIDEVEDDEAPVYDTDATPSLSLPLALYKDLVENDSADQSAEASVTSEDRAHPVIISASTRDIIVTEGYRPGLIDAVKIQFSEAVDDESISVIDFFVENYLHSGEFDALEDCDGDFETDRVENADYICLTLQEVDINQTEISTDFSTTFTGDTDATPSIFVDLDGVLSSDLAGNSFNAHTNLANEGGLAEDGAGPALTYGHTVDHEAGTLRAYFSELLDAETVGASDIDVEFEEDGADIESVSYNPEDLFVLVTLVDPFGSNDVFEARIDQESTIEDLEANSQTIYNFADIEDAIDPVITSMALTNTSTENNTLRTGDSVDLVVTADLASYCGEIEDTCIVLVNGINVTDTLVVEDNIFTFTYTVASDDSARQSGAIPVSVTYYDEAGNETITTTVEANQIAISHPSSSSSGSSGGGGGGDNKNTTPVITTTNSVYDQEVARVMDSKIVTEGPTAAANKCEVLMMMSRAFEWEVPTSTTSPYTDVPEWCVSAATFGTSRGIVEGRTATTLGMETPVTRFEVALMLYRELKLQKYEFKGTETLVFSDDLIAWAKDAVEILAKEGIIKGFANGTFGGTQGILKQDLGVMLMRVVDSMQK